MSTPKDNITAEAKKILIDFFELDEAQLTPDAKLYEDLGIDSIDTIDLIIELKKFGGNHITPERFKNVKTFQDVINILVEENIST